MTPIDLLAAHLRREEGFVAHAYQDSEGYWTIGCGHLIDKRRGGGISRAAGEFILNEDITAVLADLDRFLLWWRELDDVRQRVLAAMAFQLGWAGLACVSSARPCRQFARAGSRRRRRICWIPHGPSRRRRGSSDSHARWRPAHGPRGYERRSPAADPSHKEGLRYAP